MKHIDRIEALDRARRRTLLGFLVAFVAWQVPTIVEDAAGATLAGAGAAAVAVLGAVAAAVWVVYSVRLWRLSRALCRDPEAAAALDDERVAALRLRALAFAFWVLVVFLTAVRLAAFMTALPAGVVAQIGLLLAAVAAVGAFLFLDRG